MKMRYSEFFARQAQEYIETAQGIRQHNRSLKRPGKAAQEREAMVPTYVQMARESNHKSLEWRRIGE